MSETRSIGCLHNGVSEQYLELKARSKQNVWGRNNPKLLKEEIEAFFPVIPNYILRITEGREIRVRSVEVIDRGYLW